MGIMQAPLTLTERYRVKKCWDLWREYSSRGAKHYLRRTEIQEKMVMSVYLHLDCYLQRQ